MRFAHDPEDKFSC